MAKQFLQAVYSAEPGSATGFVTANTQNLLPTKPQTASPTPAEESFSFATLSETVNGDAAEVKNEAISLALAKENGEWRVALTPQTASAIATRQEQLYQVQQQWQALFKEYKSRVLVAKDFVHYKKGRGALSPALQNLDAAVSQLLAQTDAPSLDVPRYISGQRNLDALIEKAYEPTQTASADISLNYFLQLNQAADRIKTAVAAYNEVARKVPASGYAVIE